MSKMKYAGNDKIWNALLMYLVCFVAKLWKLCLFIHVQEMLKMTKGSKSIIALSDRSIHHLLSVLNGSKSGVDFICVLNYVLNSKLLQKTCRLYLQTKFMLHLYHEVQSIDSVLGDKILPLETFYPPLLSKFQTRSEENTRQILNPNTCFK